MAKATVRRHTRNGKTVRQYKRRAKLSTWAAFVALLEILVALVDLTAGIIVALVSLILVILGVVQPTKRSGARRRRKTKTLTFASGKKRKAPQKRSQRRTAAKKRSAWDDWNRRGKTWKR